MATTTRTIESASQYTPSGRGKWMALAAALLGWMFDGFEMGLFPLVARPALADLLGVTDDVQIGRWFGGITAGFLVGAATGGVLFGWLGDRVGRVRAMTLSVLTYAIFSGMCGLATNATQLVIFRLIAALGMGGEWALGVALVTEIWPNRSRAFLAGLIGAAANVGYLLVGVLGLALAQVLGVLTEWLHASPLPEAAVDRLVSGGGWRILLVSGAAPALLTFLIRLFVPESERWEREKKKGTTSHWATRDLLGVLIGSLAPCLMIFVLMNEKMTRPFEITFTPSFKLIVTLLAIAVATIGYTYPVMRFVGRATAGSHNVGLSQGTILRRMLLGACLGGVALLGTWGSTQWASVWADQLSDKMAGAKEYTQIFSSIGAICGTILAAMCGGWFGRRITYFVLCVAGLLSALAFFQFNDAYGPQFLASILVAGFFTASFYGWLPLYLPELFPTSVRATGQGFAFNFGRILAAVGVLQTGNLMAIFQQGDSVFMRTAESVGLPNTTGYPLACSVMSMIYIVGMVIIWIAPETRGKPLPE